MCGISGIIYSSDVNERRNIVENMLKMIAHRGPDESGMYHSRNATMGCARLSIIDIKGGRQPIADESKRYWVVFNGEIFNYIELRKKLLTGGMSFRTNSDTEVLVQLYNKYKEKSVEMLNGEYAFAIWDNLREELFLARDRVGIRPLYYCNSLGDFAFASEIKALFAVPGIIPKISYKSLVQIFTFWTTISPNTAFENIFEVPPGCYMIVNKHSIKIQKYWDYTFEKNPANHSFVELMEQFHELFMDSVQIRLRSDVKVAAYLSGGLDSSTIVSYIKDNEHKRLNTFSIGFHDYGFDETKNC